MRQDASRFRAPAAMAGALAATLLWAAACAGPGPGSAGAPSGARGGVATLGGPDTGLTGTHGPSGGPESARVRNAEVGTSQNANPKRDPRDWGSVSFRVKWPGADRMLAYIHPDTNVIEIRGFTPGGAPLLNANGFQVQGSLDRSRTSLQLTDIPSGSARFEAVAKNPFGTVLATGSTTVQVEGATTTAARLILGLPGEPSIASFSPTSGIPGYTAVDINGANFDTTVPGFSVTQAIKVGNTPATSISARSPGLVTFTVPIGAVNGPLTFTWSAQGVTKSATSSATFRVIKSIAIAGDATVSVTRGDTLTFSATANDTDDAPVADAGIPWMLTDANCSGCQGTSDFVGQLGSITGATISFLAQNTGTVTVQAGFGSVVATVGITVK